MEAGREVVGVEAEPRARHERDIAGAQEVVVAADIDRPVQGCVGEHEVDAVDRQLGQEALMLVLVTHEVDPGLHQEDRGEEMVREHFRQNVGDPDHQAPRTGCATCEGVLEPAAEGENLVGVAEDQFAAFRRLEAPTDPLEEGFPEGLLEDLELARDRRLREL